MNRKISVWFILSQQINIATGGCSNTDSIILEKFHKKTSRFNKTGCNYYVFQVMKISFKSNQALDPQK